MSHSPVWLVFPLWLLFVGIVFSRVGLLIHYNHEFLDTKQTVQGRVVKKMDHLLDHFSDQRIYVLIYSYEAGNVAGWIRTGVDRRTYERVKSGGPIPIAYLPSDPRQNSIDYPWELSDRDAAPMDVFSVALAGFIPGVILIAYFARRNRIFAHLMKSGARTWGEVMELKKTHTRYGSHSYVIFRFRAPGADEIVGRSASLPEAEHHHWQAGDPIEVTYDPKRPRYFAVDIRHPLEGGRSDRAGAANPRNHLGIVLNEVGN